MEELKFCQAANANNIEYVREVLAGEHGSVTSEDVNLALIKAALNGHEECVRLLLDHSANINATNGAEDTALSTVEESVHLSIPKFIYMLHGYSSLMFTVLQRPENYRKILRLLLDAGMNVNEIDHQDMTLLHHAGNKCTEDVIEMLIEAGAKVNTKDVYGVTLLCQQLLIAKSTM
ncbi:hypothetical protein DPMN_032719 [Dreissena polymorpha]|uniref:Ankyrin repeat protein n=1 Tax=Dreissena polymorpha TaxID=45954 RepID=A0A9D4RKI3_DREPO|nr:hypothetical protein DPMN_032719 [Dreissena polymorpha]